MQMLYQQDDRIWDLGISFYSQNDFEGFQVSGVSFLKPDTCNPIRLIRLKFQAQKEYF